MFISTEKLPELDLTIFTPSGEAPFSDLMVVLECFYKGSPTKNAIWDCSLNTNITITSRELESIAKYTKSNSELRPAGNTALVANTALKYGLARMAAIFYELEAAPWDIEIFEDLDSALEWIAECEQLDDELKQQAS